MNLFLSEKSMRSVSMGLSCAEGCRRRCSGRLGAADNRRGVAQISNLLYRRLPVGRLSVGPGLQNYSMRCGLEIRDAADWKSALRVTRGAGDVAQISNLPYRRLPVGR